MSDRRMPVHTEKVEMKNEWEGWTFTALMNPPLRVYEDLISGKVDRIAPALSNVLIVWNFVDVDGNDLPQPTEQVIRDNLSLELVTAVVTSYTDKQTTLPKG